MDIVWVTSEAFPYAKTGGLADVSAALPKAMAEQGHKVSVIMPYYPQIMKEMSERLTVRHKLLEVPFWGGNKYCRILEDKLNDNLSYLFIEYHEFYDRPALYDWHGEEYEDNAERFIFLSRAVMEIVVALDMTPDLLHTNDWHSSLCNLYLKSPLYNQTENFRHCKSVLTIHNIGYQGIFDKYYFYHTGLDWDCFDHSCLEYHDQINLLKSGVLSADIVNTVSPSYAAEILLAEYAFTLEGPLQHVDYNGKLRGILNGIDTDEWNPETDEKIPVNYSRNNLDGKWRCKAALQEEFGLPQRPDVPVFGVVSRLAYQKGLDIFAEAVDVLAADEDAQFIILGSGDKWLEGRFSYLASKYPDRVAIYVGYNDKLSHLVEAGSDIFVMPSRYEPCGLNQMYSMRYGTVPLVRGTGGLEDTVFNYDPKELGSVTGFKFYELNCTALVNTTKWAIDIYCEEPENFRRLVLNGMDRDFSWQHTAALYEQLYRDAGARI